MIERVALGHTECCEWVGWLAAAASFTLQNHKHPVILMQVQSVAIITWHVSPWLCWYTHDSRVCSLILLHHSVKQRKFLCAHLKSQFKSWFYDKFQSQSPLCKTTVSWLVYRAKLQVKVHRWLWPHGETRHTFLYLSVTQAFETSLN